MKVFIKTYGCCANQDNSEIISGLISNKHKIINDIKDSDLIIINSCVVKEKPEQKIVYFIKEIIKKYPKKKLIIAGCMPEARYSLCRKIAPNASLINTFHITKINELINFKKRLEFLGKIKELKLGLKKIRKSKDISNTQIAEGCLSSCFYCETKLAKGNLFSFPEQEIIKEVQDAIKEGCTRINITATDCGCYGLDIKTNLPILLKKIINIDGNFNIRIGMINPEYLLNYLDELIKIYKSDKIIKFLHIPVQSGSDKVLKEMNRKYSIKDFKKIVNKFRKEIPNIRISTDIIVGYSSETEKDFNETIKLIKEIKPDILNLSKFAPRPRTKAALLKQLPSEEIKRRSVILSKIYKDLR